MRETRDGIEFEGLKFAVSALPDVRHVRHARANIFCLFRADADEERETRSEQQMPMRRNERVLGDAYIKRRLIIITEGLLKQEGP